MIVEVQNDCHVPLAIILVHMIDILYHLINMHASCGEHKVPCQYVLVYSSQEFRYLPYDLKV